MIEIARSVLKSISAKGGFDAHLISSVRLYFLIRDDTDKFY